MALPLFAIGDFEFITLARTDDPASPPTIVSPQVRLIEREGVNGTGIMRTGERGKPAQYRSYCDFATLQAAMDAAKAYDEAIGLGRYGLIWHDIDYSVQFGCDYVVTDVEIGSLIRSGAMAGGFIGSGQGWLLEAIWTLLPVPAAT